MKTSRRAARIALAAVVVILALPLLALAQVPQDAYRHRAELVRNARMIWGMDAPTATFAAQIHQESRWHDTAVSPVGARGVAQFMPATAQWIGGAYSTLGPGDPTNPAWAIRALVTYDLHLFKRVDAVTPCERFWKVLWAYNGGETWVHRDEKRAAQAGRDPRRVTEVEPFNAGRSAAAFAENRGYPRVILTKFEPRYVAAGFGVGVCS
ncbi:MAG: lytic transglycosylase domain-containing protein [Rhodocyclaceae bacterium]|nr:lytic transglycosylase domain-containing protein [Rhodocyclaceae bacterium]